MSDISMFAAKPAPSLILYEVAGANDMRFSPYAWRSKLAMAHLGFGFDTVPLAFTAIGSVDQGQHKTVPIVDFGDRFVSDSWRVAIALDQRAPQGQLFGSPHGFSFAKFLHDWIGPAVLGPILKLAILDIYAQLKPEDKDYFRTSREKRFGCALEEICPNPDAERKALASALFPMRRLLADQAFLGGEKPIYADYILFGALQFARVTCDQVPVNTLGALEPWFERCLDLYGGLGRSEPAFANKP